MTTPDPLPFRLKQPSDESISLDGIEEVSYKLEGLLHVKEQVVLLEWTGSECVLPLTAEFSTSGTRSERVRAVPARSVRRRDAGPRAASGARSATRRSRRAG